VDKWERGATGLLALMIPGGGVLAAVGLAKDSASYDARGWYIAAAALAAFAVFVWTWTFLLWPVTVRMSKWRHKTLSVARGAPAINTPTLSILQAVYSYEDVTGAVSRQVLNGRLNITVLPETFGIVDPAPGSQKTLGIRYAIGGVEDYRTWVDGQQAVLPP
jgi:hypothetical protein